MEFDTRLISNRMIGMFGTYKNCAKASGIPASTICRNLKSGRWTNKQICILIDTLCINPKDINLYFFNVKVPKKQQ